MNSINDNDDDSTAAAAAAAAVVADQLDSTNISTKKDNDNDDDNDDDDDVVAGDRGSSLRDRGGDDAAVVNHDSKDDHNNNHNNHNINNNEDDNAENDDDEDDDEDLFQNDDDDDNNNNPNNSSSLLHLSLNQDGSCLAMGTTSGFIISNLYPHYAAKKINRTSSSGGGIGHVAMLYRCNLLALIGGGPCPKYPPNRVLIWDDHQERPIGELSFRQQVLKVLLRRDAIAVCLRDRIYVYNLGSLTVRDKIYTSDNGHGLLALSTSTATATATATAAIAAATSTSATSTSTTVMVLACPSVRMGQVRVELYHVRKTVLVEAHEGALRAIALTADGSLLATASEKGTLIRVWNVTAQSTCLAPLYEFRRGVQPAQITCLSFDNNNSSSSSTSGGSKHHHQYVAACSKNGTAHVFYMNHNQQHQHQNGTTTRGHGHNASSSSSSSIWKSVKNAGMGMMTGASSSNISSSNGAAQKIRGVAHPQTCAFLADRPRTLVVAGLDEYGNGVVCLSEFVDFDNHHSNHHHHLYSNNSSSSNNNNNNNNNNEPKRIAYHVVFGSHKSALSSANIRNKKDARKMKIRGNNINSNSTNAAIMEGMIQFEEHQGGRRKKKHDNANHNSNDDDDYDDDDDDFVSVITTMSSNKTTTTPHTSTTRSFQTQGQVTQEQEQKQKHQRRQQEEKKKRLQGGGGKVNNGTSTTTTAT